MTASRASYPQPPAIDADAPLRLHTAAVLAFPDGDMTAKGLRREWKRGRLVIERVAGKDYTTLANIKRMRELCRLSDKAQGCGFAKSAETDAGASVIPPSGSSAMVDTKKALDAARMIVSELRNASRPISRASTSTARPRGNVVRMKFR